MFVVIGENAVRIDHICSFSSVIYGDDNDGFFFEVNTIDGNNHKTQMYKTFNEVNDAYLSLMRMLGIEKTT